MNNRIYSKKYQRKQREIKKNTAVNIKECRNNILRIKK